MKTPKETVSGSLWDMDKLSIAPETHDTHEYEVQGFSSFFFKGTSYKGTNTWVYAYYKVPDGIPPEGGWPAVVLVHGGRGTAFYKWVQKCVDIGFAAISMDLEGHLPDLKIMFDQRSQHAHSGPSQVGHF
jgi:hypothetical protein